MKPSSDAAPRNFHRQKFPSEEYNFPEVTFPEWEHLIRLCSIEFLDGGQAPIDQEFTIRAHPASNLAIRMLIR